MYASYIHVAVKFKNSQQKEQSWMKLSLYQLTFPYRSFFYTYSNGFCNVCKDTSGLFQTPVSNTFFYFSFSVEKRKRFFGKFYFSAQT